jgi:chemotaxis response regulator CheB
VTAVRVVVVEDSPVQRAHLVDVLEAERDITVVGQAGDPVAVETGLDGWAADELAGVLRDRRGRP